MICSCWLCLELDFFYDIEKLWLVYQFSWLNILYSTHNFLPNAGNNTSFFMNIVKFSTFLIRFLKNGRLISIIIVNKEISILRFIVSFDWTPRWNLAHFKCFIVYRLNASSSWNSLWNKIPLKRLYSFFFIKVELLIFTVPTVFWYDRFAIRISFTNRIRDRCVIFLAFRLALPCFDEICHDENLSFLKFISLLN